MSPSFAPRPISITASLLALSAVLLGACAEDVPESNSREMAEPRTFTVRDSAQIALKISPPSALARTAWVPSPEPVRLLDGSEGGRELSHAIGAIALGNDGGVIVADRGEMAVRVYGADGQSVWVLGREGEGPGEFGALNGLGLRGDSLFVYDSREFRISVFAPDGTFVRQFRPESAWGNGPRWHSFVPGVGILTTSQRRGEALAWGIHEFDGAPLTDFPQLPGAEPPKLVPIGSGAESLPLRLFAPRPGGGPWQRGMVGFSGDRYRLLLADTTGRIAEIWSVADALPPQVTDEDVRQAHARALRRTEPRLHAQLERRWAGAEVPERFPAFGSGEGMVYTAPPEVTLTASGEVWVRGYPTEADRGPIWWVFGADGMLKGSTEFVPHFELHAVADGRAAGILLGEHDLQRVAVFELQPGG